MLTKIIKNCLIVLLYVFLPWSLTCYALIGTYYLIWGRKYDTSGDSGIAVLFGAPLIPFMLGYWAYLNWRYKRTIQQETA